MPGLLPIPNDAMPSNDKKSNVLSFKNVIDIDSHPGDDDDNSTEAKQQQ